ncbi:hypothetical protein BUE76_17260 [Cnuella takakiae]|nr:hypothetical protein BUE76_17260 [Cnuella takakiae]
MCCCLHLLVRAQVYIPAGAQNQVTGAMVVADSITNQGKLTLGSNAHFYFSGAHWAETFRQNTYGQGLVLFTSTQQQTVSGNLQLYRTVVNGAGVSFRNEFTIDSALYLEGGGVSATLLKTQNAAWITRRGGSLNAKPQGNYNLSYPQYQPLVAGAEALGSGLQNVNIENIAGVTITQDLAAKGRISGVGTLIFAGARQQVLRADAGFALGQLFVQNAAGLSLSSSGSISNMLRLDAGKLYLNNELLTLMPDAAIEGYSKDRYLVAGTNLGRVRRLGFAGQELFPMGTSEWYLPVTVTHTQPADFTLGLFSGITANALEGGPPAEQKPFMVDLVWTTETSNPANTRVNLEWQPQLEGSRFNELDLGMVGLWAFRGGWQLQNTAIQYNQTSRQVAIQLPTSGRFAIGANDTLATNMKLALTARKGINGEAVSLQWLVNIMGVRSGRFYLEHSTDGMHFSALQQIQPVGLSYYSGLHSQPPAGINYYRVVYQSTSGLKVYSNVAVVSNFGANDFLQAFPNPTQGPVNLRFTTSTRGPAVLRIFNDRGRLVQSREVQLEAGVNTIRTDLTMLSAATYIIQVRYEAVKVIKLDD